jgi:nucleotidyltransferase/DNA polymerase involved in DNA repair
MRTLDAIGHCDADAFYVSAERVRNRFLLDKPVAVLGNQGACVIAKSYEMKAYGVKTGEPIWEAYPKCPGGLYVKRDFRWYEVLSRLMLGTLRDLSSRVEYHSIDEFFFLATPPRGKTHVEWAEAIRDRVWERVRVPVTVGIARTRTLAKLLSDAAKPFGAKAVMDEAGEAALLADRPVTEIAGIAGRRERRLLPWNIRTCLDLARADRRLIRQLLTAAGEALWWELNGDPVLPLHPDRPAHQVLARGGSFGEPTSDPGVIFAWLVRNLERLIEELYFHEVRTGRLTVWVAYRHGEARQGQTSLAAPSERFDLLLDAARPCLRRAWIPKASANRMHLIAERLVPRGKAQLGLFEPGSSQAEAIARLKRAVNERHGRFILRSGATLPLAAIYRDKANEFDVCDVRGKMCF